MNALSQLKTEKIWLEEIDIRLAKDFDEKGPEEYKIKVDIDTLKRKDSLNFRVRLAFKLTPVSGCLCRYDRISVTTMGQFSIPEDTPEDVVHRFIPLNCLAILHGFSRGIVAQITGLNDGGPFLLPTINFVDALKAQRRKPKSGVEH